MIKLIATDIDGTLVKESSKDVYEELLDAVDRLADQGVHFVVASGRQYASIYRMFEKVADRISIIAENGAHLVMDGRDFALTPMNRDYVERIMLDLRDYYPHECFVVASTPKGCLLETENEEFIHLMRDYYRNEVQLTSDILNEQVPILKIAIYKKDGIRTIGERVLIPRWKDRVKVCMAGEEWVDFMDASVDKGNALRILQEALAVSRNETMAFGDNDNDIGLMMVAGESYAVENATGKVMNAAKYTCPSYAEKGVWQVLKREFGL